MQQESLAAWVCTALMRIGTRMATGFDQYFVELGVTQAQFRLLLAAWMLGGRDGIAPSKLADHLLIERATVSVLGSGLVKSGWLERKPGENRRSHRLAITAAGQRTLERVVPRALALADETLVGLNANQMQALRANLELIETNLRSFKHGDEHES